MITILIVGTYRKSDFLWLKSIIKKAGVFVMNALKWIGNYPENIPEIIKKHVVAESKKL